VGSCSSQLAHSKLVTFCVRANYLLVITQTAFGVFGGTTRSGTIAKITKSVINGSEDDFSGLLLAGVAVVAFISAVQQKLIPPRTAHLIRGPPPLMEGDRTSKHFTDMVRDHVTQQRQLDMYVLSFPNTSFLFL